MDGSEEAPITRKACLEILACIINIESAMISGTSKGRDEMDYQAMNGEVDWECDKWTQVFYDS